MEKTVSITLGGEDYVVPRLNIGQLEEVTDLLDGSKTMAGFKILRIAMQRAVPGIKNVDAIEATPDEVSAAVNAVLEISGFAKPKDAPKTVTADAATGEGSAES